MENNTKAVWAKSLITIMLVFLVGVSVTQAYQTAVISKKIKSADFQTSSQKSSDASSGVNNLPSAVGGC